MKKYNFENKDKILKINKIYHDKHKETIYNMHWKKLDVFVDVRLQDIQSKGIREQRNMQN